MDELLEAAKQILADLEGIDEEHEHSMYESYVRLRAAVEKMKEV
jgi:hypothetical protein